MGLKSKRSRPWLSRLHFLVRLLGLTGVLAAAAALVLAHVQGLLGSADSWRQRLLTTVQGQAEGDLLARAAPWAFLAGVIAAGLWLLIEALGVLRFTAGRRSVFGLNAVAQVGLAAVLVVGVNVFSFDHYVRVDCTSDRQFTLPADVQEQLRQLRGETTIVVLQQRRKADADPEFEDYHSAAEAVVVEKVRDLAEQLREFGPQFKVVLLDARQKNYRTRLAEVTKGQPKLAAAIKEAPGNSIFFSAHAGEGDKARADVQRLSFDDFYQLNRTLSQKAEGGKGNLVLLKKGIDPLARRILNLEEKRPRVGILVIDEYFSTAGPSRDLALGGLKKTLEQHGFEVRDVVLKHIRGRDPRLGTWVSEPAADTIEETRYEELSNSLQSLPEDIKEKEASVKLAEKRKKVWETATKADLRRYARELEVAEITEKQREQQVEMFGTVVDRFRADLAVLHKQLRETRDELAKLNPDRIGERQRMSDLTAKLRQTLVDCDLLLLPRMTVLPDGYAFPDAAGLFHLEAAQVGIVKEFLKDGKPLLACLGPLVDARSQRAPSALADLLAELGIKLSKQTVVYDTQTAERRSSRFVTTRRPVPALDLETALATLRPLSGKEPVAKQDNPLRRSLMLARQAWGGGLDLRLRYPRPVYYDADDGAARKRSRARLAAALTATPLQPLAALSPKLLQAGRPKPLAVAPEFLWTSVSGWNDDNPMRPGLRFAEPKPDDPTRGTRDERRKGRFPIGVAVEAKLPRDWYADKGRGAKRARVAVIGHGGVFVDPELPPEREKLLLDSCNWLLGRDDLLTQESATWSYPRLELSERDKDLWLWGTRLGLPALFAYLGLVVLLARRVR